MFHRQKQRKSHQSRFQKRQNSYHNLQAQVVHQVTEQPAHSDAADAPQLAGKRLKFPQNAVVRAKTEGPIHHFVGGLAVQQDLFWPEHVLTNRKKSNSSPKPRFQQQARPSQQARRPSLSFYTLMHQSTEQTHANRS